VRAARAAARARAVRAAAAAARAKVAAARAKAEAAAVLPQEGMAVMRAAGVVRAAGVLGKLRHVEWGRRANRHRRL